MTKAQAKDLVGNEYELISAFDNTIKDKHKPDIEIVPFSSFGLGTSLQMEKAEIGMEWQTSVGPVPCGTAVVKTMYEEDDKIIIIAEKETKKEEKVKYANKIVEKIDFRQGLANERFVEMLTNVFSEDKLNEILEADDIEVLLFSGLTYLKVGNKAYRL